MERHIGPVLDNVFPFAGERCERLTVSVLTRLGMAPATAAETPALAPTPETTADPTKSESPPPSAVTAPAAAAAEFDPAYPDPHFTMAGALAFQNPERAVGELGEAFRIIGRNYSWQRHLLANLVTDAPGAADEADSLLLGDAFSRTPIDRIAVLFGDDFASGLAHAAPAQWVGPLRSAYGLHLVLITAIEPAATPPFEEVRPAVEREWFAERRSEAQAAQYQAVRSGYKVTVRDWPAAAQ
jgi:hypothetical protein